MRVFVAGASGAIGSRLVPQLIDRGHEVIGTAQLARQAPSSCGRSAPSRSRSICSTRARCARPCSRPEPEAIVHEATALADVKLLPQHGQDVRARPTGCGPRGPTPARRRARGRRAPVRRAELRRLPLRARGRAGQDRGRPARPRRRRPARARRCAAMRHLEEAVTDSGGIALRYGGFYGAANDGLIEPVRKRQFPIVGDGGGVWSFIHLDDAAAATVLALEHDGAGDLQHRRRRARAGARVAAGARRAPRRQAAAPRPRLARAADRRRGRGHDVPRRAAPRTRRPSASSAGRRATRAGAGLRGCLRSAEQVGDVSPPGTSPPVRSTVPS